METASSIGIDVEMSTELVGIEACKRCLQCGLVLGDSYGRESSKEKYY